jgi:putative DNA primase/helicase
MLTAEDTNDTETQATLFTDANLAAMFAGAIEGEYVFINGLGWHHWTGKRWETCADKEVREVARQWTLRQHLGSIESYKEVVTDGRSKAEQQAARQETTQWERYQIKAKLDAITALASGIVTAEAFACDARPDLLNCNNGVIDLKTGKLLAHNPGLLMTKLAPVNYIPGAKHPDWTDALEALPADLRDWYQLRLGQAITGHMTPDDMMLVQHGAGENGKGTVMAGVRKAIGDYYLDVPHRALLADSHAHPTELTEFRGARLALLEELPGGRELNVARLKQLVGTDVMTARKIARDSIHWQATHTLIVSTNSYPLITDTDHGTWRRLALVRFPYRWCKPGEELRGDNDRRGDPTLRARMNAGADGQHEAVLAWLVAGAVRWYQAEEIMPPPPRRVIRDTASWRQQYDLIFAFFHEALAPDLEAHVISTELLGAFNRWAQARGYHEWSDRTFTSRFAEHEEVTGNQVAKRTIRAKPGISRPPNRTALPGQDHPPARYAAWVGVRFRASS